MRAIAWLVSLTILCGVPQPSAADDKSWSRLETCGVGPSERSRPAVAALGSKIYVFGGGFDEFASGDFVFYDDLFELDTRSARWQALSPEGERPAPRAFAGHAALDRGRGFVVFGGGTFASDQSVTSYGDLWRYSPADARWSRLSDEPQGPGKRFDSKVWTHAGKVYVFGGLTESYEVTNDLWAFDLSSGVWRVVTENGAAGSPPARGVARGPDRAYHNQLYFYGGEGGQDTSFQIYDDTWAFDLHAGAWLDLTPAGACQVDPARNHNSVARIGHDLYAYGGDVPGGPQSCGAPFPQNPVAELWKLDTRTACWERVAASPGRSPPPLKRHAAVTVGNAMYLLSGYDFAANGGSEACQVWNLDVWVYR
jgi:N-acetylneuraminic acid mutarotase